MVVLCGRFPSMEAILAAQEALPRILDTARQAIREEGFSYSVSGKVERVYFNTRQYDSAILPAGVYDAVQIRIGKAEGKNWWCVLYPNLCFTSSTCAVVDEEGKEELKSVLTDEEYEMITATTDFKIKSFFFGEGTDDKSK